MVEYINCEINVWFPTNLAVILQAVLTGSFRAVGHKHHGIRRIQLETFNVVIYRTCCISKSTSSDHEGISQI